MLKTSCVLLKVLLLTKAAIASSLEDLKDLEVSDIPVSKINNINMLLNIVSVRIDSDSVAVRNEVESIPSEPIFPRAFVEFVKSVNKKNNISVTFRWKQPEFTNGVIQKYTVEYWFIKNLTTKKTIEIDNNQTTILQFEVYDLKPDTLYYFQVRAHNKVGASNYTNINVSTTHENPVPLLLVNSSSGMMVWDKDLQKEFPLNEYRAMEFAYSALERKIYWINDKRELMTTDLNTSSIKTKQNYKKIADLDASAHNLCIDWVARNLYWIQISNQTSNIMKLDLTLWQQIGTVKIHIVLEKINGPKFLNVLPSTGYLYWMELNSDNKFVIMQSEGRKIKPFLKSNLSACSCPNELEPSALQIDNTNIDKPLIYWTSEDRLIAADIYGCTCSQIFSTGDNKILFNYLTIDKTNIYLHSNSERLIYILEKKYALLESKENAFKRVQKVNMLYTSDTHRVIAFGKSLQQYPSPSCLIPDKEYERYHVESETITANSITVNLPKPVPNSGCEKYNLATTIYTISVSHRLNNDRNESNEFKTCEQHYKIPNLTASTDYTLKLALSNFYTSLIFNNSLKFNAGVVLTTKSKEISTQQYVLISCLVVTLVVTVLHLYQSHLQRKESNEQILSPRMPDIELTSRNNISSEYVEYNPKNPTTLQYELNKFKCPIINREQITLGDLLGKGAFAKVFQGTVQNLKRSGTITSVAIKIPRKYASRQEITKFKQEAKIMSHFRHKNVLRLLGICMDVNSLWLILELMEAGDLQKYLRDSRTLQPLDLHALRLQDLLGMCEDVARGCCYLEKLHFVHRDLSCRNCLIFSRNRETRIVKIGDFGLARNIYTKDYYRMERENKVPVRWMAPESLKFQKFTLQSDVWAFGVLMWEITSLGEHPYSVRNNLEVEQFVCEGGRLTKPHNCPPMLYRLIRRCWSAENDRPNFILCLENIVTMRDNIEDAILSSVDIISEEDSPFDRRQIEEDESEDVVGSTSNSSEYVTADNGLNNVIESSM